MFYNYALETSFFLSGVYNPCEFEPPYSWGYEITHKNTPQSGGLLRMNDQPVAETTWQHTTQQKTFMPPAVFEPAIPAGDWPQTLALNVIIWFLLMHILGELSILYTTSVRYDNSIISALLCLGIDLVMATEQ